MGFGNKKVCFTYLEVPYISDPLKNDQFQQETEFANCQIHYHAFKQSVSGKEMFHIKLHQITEWPESKKVIILFYVKSSEGIHTFFIRNSCVRNLYWDGQVTEKHSVLKPKRFKILIIFSHSYHNFKDTATNFDKDMFRKESFCGTNSNHILKCRYLFEIVKSCFPLLIVIY